MFINSNIYPDLLGKNALVTGASRGIGRSIAFAFARAGCSVAINSSQSQEALSCVKGEIEALGVKCALCLGDVADYEACVALHQKAVSELGPIDILVNNAGISHIGLFSDMKPEQWQRLLSVNLFSVLHMTHVVTPEMVRRKSGCILNISSMWGERGASCEAVYSASKGGINAFTKAMAKELGPSGIRVNAISCGAIDTSMNQFLSPEEKQCLVDEISLMRFGTPEEVSRLALFLAGASSSYITGQILTIDGGMV